jgi:hypothetical protein
MEDRKHNPANATSAEPDAMPKGQRRRLSRIVHDHKGNATVEWVEAPAGYERQVFEIEGEAERPPDPGSRTDLRKLSAWIKMMRELEEAKKRSP